MEDCWVQLLLQGPHITISIPQTQPQEQCLYLLMTSKLPQGRDLALCQSLHWSWCGVLSQPFICASATALIQALPPSTAALMVRTVCEGGHILLLCYTHGSHRPRLLTGPCQSTATGLKERSPLCPPLTRDETPSAGCSAHRYDPCPL